MTKLYFILITAIVFSVFTPLCVRGQAFTNKSTSILGGYGLGTFTNSFTHWFGEYSYYDVEHSEFGPVYFKIERGVTDHIGLGLNFAYVADKWEYLFNGGLDSLGNTITFSETDTRNSYSIIARMNFHLGKGKKLDPFFGFGLGYRNATWKSSANYLHGNGGIDFRTSIPLGFELTFGVRYLFTPNFGVYTEWGIAKSVIQLGASFYLPGIPPPAEQPLIHP